MSSLAYVAAILACGAGAVVRFSLTKIRGTWRFPWPTLLANALGSLALGAIAHAVLTAPHPDELMLIAGGGFAGGLTTFSSLAVDAVVLWRGDKRARAAAYLAASFAAGLLCAAAGWALASAA